MSANSAVITVKDLSFSYDNKRVLEGLDITLEKGKITTIMGANGCGKSTLLGILTKQLPLKQGTVMINDQDIKTIKVKAFAKQVAVVHQYHQVIDDMMVGDLVAMGRLAHQPFLKGASSTDQEIVEWALQVTDLQDLVFREMRHLSGGEKQRVWIAMALAQKTDILFLDEPTTYLDIKYQLDILRLIAKINQELGITIIMVLHDINQALSLSDQIIGLKEGKVYAQGKPETVLNQDFIQAVFGVTLPVVEKAGKQFVITSLT
ncbi:ABC transporter ATP-binding protein [Streptococcus phocae subsp. phocae]